MHEQQIGGIGLREAESDGGMAKTTLRKLIQQAIDCGCDFDQTARRVEVTFPQAKVKKIRAIYEELRGR